MKNSNHIMSLDEISNEHIKTINASWDYYIDDRHDFSDKGRLTTELNTSVKNIERWLKQLKDENKIEFKGSPKTGGYVVK